MTEGSSIPHAIGGVCPEWYSRPGTGESKISVPLPAIQLDRVGAQGTPKPNISVDPLRALAPTLLHIPDVEKCGSELLEKQVNVGRGLRVGPMVLSHSVLSMKILSKNLTTFTMKQLLTCTLAPFMVSVALVSMTMPTTPRVPEPHNVPRTSRHTLWQAYLVFVCNSSRGLRECFSLLPRHQMKLLYCERAMVCYSWRYAVYALLSP